MDATSKFLLPTLHAAQPRYHGKQRGTGLLRISHDGKRMLVRGRAAIGRSTGTSKVSFALYAMRSQPVCNFSPDSPYYVEFLAIGDKTNARYLVRGVVDRVLKSESAVAAKPKKKCMTSDEYAEELRRVKSARIADTDAMVSIQFIARHTGRAVSSIYRDVKNELLPKATKQGGSSRWSFTAVDAYAHGKILEAPIDQSHILTL